MLFEYLKEHYDDGEPIFLDDIHIEGMRRDNFRQQIKTASLSGSIAWTPCARARPEARAWGFLW